MVLDELMWMFIKKDDEELIRVALAALETAAAMDGSDSSFLYAREKARRAIKKIKKLAAE